MEAAKENHEEFEFDEFDDDYHNYCDDSRDFSDIDDHLGRNKTFYKISERYYWPGIFKDVTSAVSKTFPFSNRTIIITYYCMYTHVHTGCHM